MTLLAYLDTNALVKLYLPEASGVEVIALYGFRLNLVVSDLVRADASRKKYGLRDMDAQAAFSRLCRN